MENTTESRNRIDWIDMAKGYGMLFVILGHVGCGPLEKWVYSFHLPLFFFLSGLVFHSKNGFWDFLKKRIKGILVPYFCLGAIIVLFEVIINHIMRQQPIVEPLINKTKDLFVQIRCWDLWYLTTLFCAEIIFYIIVKIGRNTIVIGMITCAITALGFRYYESGGQGLVWNLDVVFFALFFLFAGYFCQQAFGGRIMELLDSSRTAEIILFFVAWAANIGLMLISWTRSGEQLEMYMGTYGIPLLSFPAALSGILGVIIFSKWTSFNIIRYIGKNTLIYFAWHQTIIMPLVRVLLGHWGIVPDEATGLFLSPGPWLFQLVMILVILTGLSKLISNSPLRFMVGKR